MVRRVTPFVMVFAVLALAGCAGTDLQRTRDAVYALEQSAEGAYRLVWVAVYSDALDTAAGLQADRLYREVYYPAKAMIARYLAEWEATGKRPPAVDQAIVVLRRVRLELMRLSEEGKRDG